MRHLSSFLVVVLFTVTLGSAEQPRITNGQVQPMALAGSLDRAIRDLAARSSEPAWIGYAVPIVAGEHNMCCWSGDGSFGSCCTGCRLEPGASNAVRLSTSDSSTRLEPGDRFFVLYRLEGGLVNRIRMFSEDCPLDAGGRIIHWLSGVRPGESVSVLAAYAAEPNRKPADSALSAIAMHADSTALETLVTLARSAESTHVRGQALFWLAQRAGDKAVGTITDAIDRDPETDVKKRAVFALSQLPKDQGVPLLIDLARKNANPVVRKQAIFWLGQSKDPRALQYFEEILFKK
jgi:hypothetical protein